MPQFMLVFQHGAGFELSPEQLQDAFAKFGAWADGLRQGGKLLGGERLVNNDERRTVRKRNGKFVVDGPYPETKEYVGGFITVEAADYAEAVEIAKGCPGFDFGPYGVEVRRVALRGER